MMKVKTINQILIITLFKTYSCTNEVVKQTATNQLKEQSKKVEQFEDFYEKFHSNNEFQLERIKFPLEGYNYDHTYNPTNEVDSNFVWQKSSWDIHHKPVKSDSLKIKWNRKNDTIEEIITIPNSGTEIIRRFTLIDGKWYLVFYGNQSL